MLNKNAVFSSLKTIDNLYLSKLQIFMLLSLNAINFNWEKYKSNTHNKYSNHYGVGRGIEELSFSGFFAGFYLHSHSENYEVL